VLDSGGQPVVDQRIAGCPGHVKIAQSGSNGLGRHHIFVGNPVVGREPADRQAVETEAERAEMNDALGILAVG